MMEVKVLYADNCKTLIKEIEDDLEKDITCSWTRRINTVKMSILSLPKEIYRFSTSPITILFPFFTEMEQTILKFV